LSPDTARTVAMDPGPTQPTSTPVTGLASAGSRFIPGAMVANRYRIVGLLGRGGMGEVYRADDLKLGQPVALKFLPPGLERDPALLERFLNEVRTALKVTHPNVCRVYDIGEVDGQHFLSMEYVDGEDLASLLRRIGRLPQERAVQVARQICAGLAAAHEQGILHRDLKPANVMIDGRGQVRLTDFGLAGLAGAIGQEDISSGTPGYMAPEQIAGQEVSVRSDIYSLGLVFYEIFTGRPVFQGDTVDELTRHHTSSLPSHPSEHVEGIDPAVERAVLRCLEKNPKDRPSSVLAVSASLPGGDPLAAALAAGETPSPELVAEAGSREGMRPWSAFLLASAALLVILGGAHWSGKLTITNFLPLEKRPEVLVDRARDIAEADSSRDRWEGLRQRPDAAAFWYRQSPGVLLPTPRNPPIFTRGNLQMMNPTPGTPGEVSVLLDLDGKLRRFEVLPKRFSTREPSAPDWDPLFVLAGLDRSRFTEDRPRYQRFMVPDLRLAWIGSRAEAPEMEIRVEAGSFEGRPVLFNVTTSASLESLGKDPEPDRENFGWYITNLLQPLLILGVVLAAAFLSRRNSLQGRTDRRGAARFATAAFTLFIVANGLQSHAMTTRFWAEDIWPLIAGATFVAAISWGLYAAAEPLGRRVWPTMFVSSSRLLSRPRVQWLDPVIGKSVLIGVLFAGIRLIINGPVNWWVRYWTNGEPPRPLFYDLELLQGQRVALSSVLDLALGLDFILIFVMALIVIRMMVKRRIPALILTLVVWTLIDGPSSTAGIALSLVTAMISMVVLLRWGVLALVTSFLLMWIGYGAQAADWSAWHAQGAVLALVIVVAVTLYGAWAAVGGRSSRLDQS